MDYDSLTCLICSVNFDTHLHLPRVIPECGHTLCSSCIHNLIKSQLADKCPLDNLPVPFHRRGLHQFPINFVFKQLLEEMTSREDFCSIHDEEKRLICMTDKTTICDFCALFGDHKGHEVRPIKDMKPELNKKKAIVEQAIECLEDQCRETNQVLELARESMLNTSKRRFRTAEYYFTCKELETKAKINQFFDSQKELLNKGLGRYSALRQDLTMKLAEYKQPNKAEKFLTLLSEDVSQYSLRINKEALAANTKQLGEDLKFSTNILDKNLSVRHRIESDFPTEELSKGFRTYFEGYSQAPFNLAYAYKSDVFTANTTLEFRRIEDSLTIISRDNQPKEVSVNTQELQDIENVVIKIREHNLEREDTTILFHVFNQIKKITSLSFICSSTKIRNYQFEDFFYYISSHAHEIQHFSLNLSDCSSLNDTSMCTFMETILPSFTSLEDLELRLESTDILDATIVALAEHNAPLLNRLRRFELDLQDVRISDQSATRLFVPMPRCVEYCLSLRDTEITDKTVQEFAEKTLPTMKDLKVLSIDFSYTEVTDQSVIPMLSSLKDLQTLEICLGSTEVTGKALEALGKQCLTNLTQLEHLDIVLFHNDLVDEDLAHICVPMENLKKLYFSLQGNRLTDSSLELLAVTTLASAKALKKLDMRLESTKVGDSGVSSLFLNANTLKSFMLYLDKTKVTDQFANELLMDILPRMKTLDSFDISMAETDVAGELVQQIEETREKWREREDDLME